MSALHRALREFLLTNFLLDAATARFGDADSLLEHGIMDSTGYLELIDHLEQHHGLRIADEEMTPENLETLDRIVAFLERKGVRNAG
jgi:acyl carrier protein